MKIAIRDNRKVYHWPASIRQLVEAKFAAKKSGSDTEPFQPDTPAQQRYWDLYNDARKAAGEWQLCACGSLCRAIPRVKNKDDDDITAPGIEVIPKMDEPKDKPLRHLGLRFYHAIDSEDYGLAFVTMEQIEERAAVVLSKLGKKKKNYEAPKPAGKRKKVTAKR